MVRDHFGLSAIHSLRLLHQVCIRLRVSGVYRCDEASRSTALFSHFESLAAHFFFCFLRNLCNGISDQNAEQQKQHYPDQHTRYTLLVFTSYAPASAIMLAAGEYPMQMDSQETTMLMQQDSQKMNARAAMHHHAVDDDHDNSTLAESNTHPAHDSPQAVIASIEALVSSIIEYLDREESPLLSSQHVTRRLTLSQSRSFTSICMVLSFSHSLLLSGRTTTTREVYYFFVTHFRSQRECDAAILDASNLLSVPRSSLGLYASPKGN
jgi:hypothetical protein